MIFFGTEEARLPYHEGEQPERKKHSPLVLNSCAPFSHLSLSRPGRPPPPPYRPPPLSLLLASRVVGPVVEQGVHGVFLFFSILKGGKQWCSWQVSAAGAYVARHCMRGIRDGRTDWAKMKMRERERGGGVSTRTRVYLTMQAHGYRLFFLPTVSSLLAAWLDLN